MTAAPPPPPPPAASDDDLAHAVTAYLSRYKGVSREHTHSDLRVFLTWCAGQAFHPLTVRRHELELYVRWLQEVRRFKPSTASPAPAALCWIRPLWVRIWPDPIGPRHRRRAHRTVLLIKAAPESGRPASSTPANGDGTFAPHGATGLASPVLQPLREGASPCADVASLP